ncbi:MAG TPA: DUF2550 domain-containing protein [Micromonosporaceae bacterium]|nr:DUF2550 domain-containing protein [Micromonosporaceae bacterium]
MLVLEGLGLALLALLLFLVVLFLRRAAIARSGGTVELGLRLSTRIPGRGWAAGLGRFAGDELRWYRMFSLSIRPRRVLSRRTLAVEDRRAPGGAERIVLPKHWVIVRCVSSEAEVEIAMAEPTLTGFLSWVEAAPPGGEASESRRSRAS